MSKNYLTYPCKVMNITQSYTGSYTHSQHNTGAPKDYPWDEACGDSGRSAMYCPCDEIKITRIYGVGNGGTNTIWLESTSKVYFADGTSGYLTMLVTHPNDSDIKDLCVGQKFKRGEIICYEGTDGNATGNHFHFSAGKGTGGSWIANSKGKWVLTCSGGTAKPEALFYIDKSFTAIKDSLGISFVKLPTQDISEADTESTKAKYSTGNYEVTCSLLNVRKGPGTGYGKLTFKQLTANAQYQVKQNNGGKAADGYVKGVQCTVSKITDNWGKTPSGWICLDYCKRI